MLSYSVVFFCFFSSEVATPPVFLSCMGATVSQTQAGESAREGKGSWACENKTVN